MVQRSSNLVIRTKLVAFWLIEVTPTKQWFTGNALTGHKKDSDNLMVGKKYSVLYGANIMDTVQLGEILDCSVCFERLNETCKVLPCQHTFCKGCLKAIVATRQELRCPECRCLVTENVDKLPGNILLIRLLEGLKHQQTKKYSTRAFPSKVSMLYARSYE